MIRHGYGTVNTMLHDVLLMISPGLSRSYHYPAYGSIYVGRPHEVAMEALASIEF